MNYQYHYQVQNLLLLLVFLFFGYILYRQHKKFRAEEKAYGDSDKLRAISRMYDQEEHEETTQIA